jgi:hypothetical protein
MKLATITFLAALAVTPALAQQANSDRDSKTTVTPPAENPNVDSKTAAVDTAREREYKHKLDAANAQSKADSALADRDAARAKAEDAHDDKRAAQSADR